MAEAVNHADANSGFRCLVGQAPDGIGRAVVLIENPSASTPLTTGEKEALVGPRMVW